MTIARLVNHEPIGHPRGHTGQFAESSQPAIQLPRDTKQLPAHSIKEAAVSRSINKVILVGNVGRDPDIQTTNGGTKVAHLSLATSRRVPRNGGFEDRTEWHRLTLWDRLAQIAEEYVRKGDRLYIEGRIEYDSFEKNGVTIPTAEVQVRELVMLGAPRNGSGADDGDDE
jgi:single-strand DNA-binding protein